MKVAQNQSTARPIVDSISDICFRFLKSITCKKGFVLSFSKLNNYNPSQYFDPSQVYNNLNVPFASNETEASSEKDSISAAVNSLHIKKFIPIDRYQLFHALTSKIKHLETKRHSTLAIEILKNNPELISSFWKKVKLSLEPRLSTLYLVNVGFVLKVLSINIDLFNKRISPVSKKYTNEGLASSLSAPNCPQVPQIVDYILPCSFNRLLLSKGVQFTSSPLIQYMNLNIIGHSMKKLDQFRNWIQHNIKAIENSNHINFGIESSSQLISNWKLLDSRLLQTVKRRLPEWSVILSIYRNFQSTTSAQKKSTASNGASSVIDYNTSSKTLILESLLRVISGYVKNFPDWILESRFDIGKLLCFEPSYLFDSSARINSGSSDSDPNMKFKNLIFYHVLECVSKSPSELISWNGTTNIPGSKDNNEHINYPKYNFGIAIMIYLTKSGIVKNSSKNVLVKALSEVNSSLATSFSYNSNLDTSSSNDINSRVNSAWLDSLEIASNCPKSGPINFNRVSNLVSLAEKAIISTSTSLYKFIDLVKNWSSDMSFGSSLFESLNSGPGIMASIILQTWRCVL
ncbi:Nucleolar pre-ribosomal-associated protein 1 [Smittium culicis]|uniref:Nucleolar pre-ribosomal-associated protein 1 n=1 Tax=Smittium culicis TaxID=133412 RepID=A0A1R1XT69_9FUNG|nr:Nucleolar pre-ribosomal-associated protein 1 [Smittium culicis]